MDLNPRRSAVIAVHLQNDIVTKGERTAASSQRRPPAVM
jgi:hypothetical protein